MKNAQCFCAGYVAVKSKKIIRELTEREIEEAFPCISNKISFAEGMRDALAGDSYRYRLNRSDAGIQVYGGDE